MAGDPANGHSRAFVYGSMDEQVAALREVIAEVRPQVMISYAEDGGYGHPDHVRAHQITMAAATDNLEVARVFHTVRSRADVFAGVTELTTLQGLPYRLPEPGELAVVPDDAISTVIDIKEHLPAKLRALRAHATQISVWQDNGHSAYALSNGIAQPVCPREHFVLASGPGAGAAADLFGGLGLVGGDSS
jgi:N-acetyl-1-D-myo-inositol-2-amino-2-deoxy-alpha-D-glucopyranoside deacetylase